MIQLYLLPQKIICGIYLFFEYELIECADLMTASTVATEEINGDQ